MRMVNSRRRVLAAFFALNKYLSLCIDQSEDKKVGRVSPEDRRATRTRQPAWLETNIDLKRAEC